MNILAIFIDLYKSYFLSSRLTYFPYLFPNILPSEFNMSRSILLCSYTSAHSVNGRRLGTYCQATSWANAGKFLRKKYMR